MPRKGSIWTPHPFCSPDTRWLVLNDGRGWGGGGVRHEALRRSSKEATFSEPFYVLKGIQYRVYRIFLTVKSSTQGVKKPRAMATVGGISHRKKTMFSIWKHNTKIGSAEGRIRKAVLRLIGRESVNSIMQEMTQQMDNKKRTWSFCRQTTPWKLPTFSSTRRVWTRRSVLPVIDDSYPKILKISPGAYLFKRPFVRGLFLEELIYGGKIAFRNRLG